MPGPSCGSSPPCGDGSAFGASRARPDTEWTKERLKHPQVLRRIAHRMIDLIAAFADDLVKLWTKPKCVRRSSSAIPLDRIHERSAWKEGQAQPAGKGLSRCDILRAGRGQPAPDPVPRR